MPHWGQIPHSNLSKFRDGDTCQPLFSCCYFLLRLCNMYNIRHTRGIMRHLWVLPRNNTFFLKEFLVREQVLPIQNSNFVKLKRKTPPSPKGCKWPITSKNFNKKDSFCYYPWVQNNGKIWLSTNATDILAELFEYIIKAVLEKRNMVIIIKEGHKGVGCFNMVTTKMN